MTVSSLKSATSPSTIPTQRLVEFVLKVSKFCNLRCSYCYEFEQLGNRERMSLVDLEQFYHHIATWHSELKEPTAVDFVWHGGEPLLTPPSYFLATFDHQRSILGRDVPVRNTVQTNLTVLDQSRIDLLHQFDRVGVSIDLYGELRTDIRDRDSVRRVLRNMDRLHDNGIDFGCITVLSARNVSRIRKIIDFYHHLGVRSVRLLPLIDGASADQHQAFDVPPQGVVEALAQAFERLVELDSELLVEPISTYVRQVVHQHTPGATPFIYDKSSWESVYLVDTDGSAYSYGNAYDTQFCHGNVFRSPMKQIVRSQGHLRAIDAAGGRMAEVCTGCRFFGSCSGYPMAEEAPLMKRQNEPLACNIDRPMLEYIERRLGELGAFARDSRGTDASFSRPTFERSAQLPLQRNVRVHSGGPDALPLETRLAISAGTTNRKAKPTDGLEYISAAFVPRSPFRPATRFEMEILQAAPEQPWRIGSDVAVVCIPDDVVSPLMQVFEDFGTAESLERYREHTSHPGWSNAYGRLSSFIKQHHSIDDVDPRVVRLGSSGPGNTTVTKDTVADHGGVHYVGLHVDSWTDVPLSKRAHALNRICVNLGREDRYFLFINIGLAEIHRILHGSDLSETSYYGSDLGHAFMRTFPDYPVTRLTIRPGEAYIAPTENLIHDGSTLGMTSPDLALHMIGALAPSAKVDSRP